MENEECFLYRCTLCTYVYDEEKEGVKWENLSEDWVCPECGATKEFFEKMSDNKFIAE